MPTSGGASERAVREPELELVRVAGTRDGNVPPYVSHPGTMSRYGSLMAACLRGIVGT